MAKLSHYGEKGEVRMVDVSEKAVTTRTAAARGFVKMKPRVVQAVRRLKNPKGNPLEVQSTVSTVAQTDVEMEALVAVTAAALTVYNMCKALDKGLVFTDTVLTE